MFVLIDIEKEIYLNLAIEGLRLLQNKIKSGELNYDMLKKVSMVIFRSAGKLQSLADILTRSEYEKILHACGIISISDSNKVDIVEPGLYQNLCDLETYFSFGKSELLIQNSLA